MYIKEILKSTLIIKSILNLQAYLKKLISSYKILILNILLMNFNWVFNDFFQIVIEMREEIIYQRMIFIKY